MKTREEVTNAVKNTMTELHGINPDMVTEKSTWDDLEMDDLDKVELIMSVEDRMKIDFNSQDGESDEKVLGDTIGTFIDSLMKKVG